MNKKELKLERQFSSLKHRFNKKIEEWSKRYPDIEFVYNHQLDELKLKDIKYILVGDYPTEACRAFRRYLSGSNGVFACNFFQDNNLVEFFSKEVLILYKTPIYAQSNFLLHKFYQNNQHILIETQKYMARYLYELFKLFNKNIDIFITGFGGCNVSKSTNKMLYINHKNNRYLPYFFKELAEIINKDKQFNDNLYIFKPFRSKNNTTSLGCFVDDLTSYYNKKSSFHLSEIKHIGKEYKEMFFS